jgi:uncharacterized repeat protein (TIGR01451 family)/fimbrial isopeptide formation D2 family protein
MAKCIFSVLAASATLFGVMVGVGAAPPALAQLPGCTISIDFSGEVEPPIIVPTGVTQIEVNIFGASGGDATGSSANIGEGGNGAGVINGLLAVNPGDILTVIVGGEGGPASTGSGVIVGGDGGFGWIGGSDAGDDSGGDGGDGTAHAGGGGGGASAVLLNGEILAAAGGGGGGAHGGDGGAGGATGADGAAVGDSTEQSQIGLGASTTAGGAGGTASDNGTDDGVDGGQGFGGGGGDAVTTSGGPASPDGDAGGGGGGGLFGGGGAGGGGAAGDGGGAGGGGGSTSNNIPGSTVVPDSNDGDGHVDITLAQDECPGDIGIDKSVSDPEPAIGDTITYSLVATNNGPADLAPGVVVRDNLPAGVEYVSDDCGGVNGPLLWEWDIGDLAVDEPQDCIITVEVLEAGTFTNYTSISGDNPDGNPDNNRDQIDIVVPPQMYDLEIDKAGEIQANGQIVYTLTVTNNGPDDTLIPVGVVDVLPPQVEYASDTCGGEVRRIEPPGGGAFWTWVVGAMTADQVATCSITVDVVEPGQIENCAVTASHSSEITPGFANNRDCVTLAVEPMLDIVKTVDPGDELLPGEVATYTIEVTNTGNFNYTGAVPASIDDDLTAVLDDARFNDDATATAGEVSFSEPTLHWEGSLAIGDTVTITFTVTVNDPASGDGVLTNSVTGPPGESNCEVGSEPDCTTIVPIRALLIDKVADPDGPVLRGGTVTYTVTVENIGGVDYTDDHLASITDDLTEVLDDATYNDDAATDVGTVSFSEPTLSWEGPLAVGEVATITYSVTVPVEATGDDVLVNNVTGPPEGNCSCSIETPVQSMEVAKTSDTTEVEGGDVITYTVTATNTGQAAYTRAGPASFDDDMTDVLDDAAFNDDASASAGGVSFAAPTLTWSGPLPVGETVTVTYSVTVSEAGAGNGEILNVVTSESPGSMCLEDDDENCRTLATVLAAEPPVEPGPGLPPAGAQFGAQWLVLGLALTGLGTLLTVGSRWYRRRVDETA